MAQLNGSPAAPEALQALGLTNYGHFTSMRVDNQRVRGLSQHLDRLVHDCRLLFGAELDRDRVRELVRQAVTDEHGSIVVRVTIFDPELEFGHPGTSAEPNILVTLRPAVAWPPAPMRVQTLTYRRDLPKAKHIGLFGTVLGRRNAQLNGFDDVLFIDSASFVSEGATWNIGFFDGDRVLWPNAPALPGVTMRLLKQVHDHTITTPINVRDIAEMRAAFATNAAIGVRPITVIDRIELPNSHPIFELLRKEYEDIPGEQI